MGGEDRDEDVLPEHGVDESVGSLDTSGESGESGAGDDDASLVQHAREHRDHQVGLHGVVVLGEVPVLGDAGQVESVGGGSGEHALTPGHAECETWDRETSIIDTRQEQLQISWQ